MRGREVGVTTSLHSVGAAEGDQARGEKWLTTVENTFIGYKAVKGEEEMRQCRWMGKMKMRRRFGLVSRARGRMTNNCDGWAAAAWAT
jgi:hypothetical protein